MQIRVYSRVAIKVQKAEFVFRKTHPPIFSERNQNFSADASVFFISNQSTKEPIISIHWLAGIGFYFHHNSSATADNLQYTVKSNLEEIERMNLWLIYIYHTQAALFPQFQPKIMLILTNNLYTD